MSISDLNGSDQRRKVNVSQKKTPNNQTANKNLKEEIA